MVGHDAGEQFTNHWWDHAFQNASFNICIQEDENGVRVSSKGESVKVSTKKMLRKRSSSGKKRNYLYNGSFVKSGVLTNGVVHKSADEQSLDDVASDDEKLKTNTLTDEELLQACGGRTAHKGARHGLKLSGKLARLAKHENENSNTNSMCLNSEKLNRPKKSKKKKKKNHDEENSSIVLLDGNEQYEDLGAVKADVKIIKKKKRKKSKRSLETAVNVIQLNKFAKTS
ncbi:G patch domain-containing protein 4-like isoform X2 [Clavelina lepadiformis]|uniref:G patch domain-containing protein 4-like isoform X2 n=1 Tax=Clavelina lepadiformis TaxID=159417 RepID=UPI0040429394